MQMHWDQSQTNTLWALASSAGMFRSTDFGLTWEKRSVGLPRPPTRFVVADDGTLYAGVFSTGETRIYKSSDSGGSWTEMLAPSLIGFRDITVLPGNSNVVLFNASPGNGLWRSPDGGSSWSQITAGVPSFPIAPVCQPGSSTVCLLGATVDGVFKSTNAGLSWTVSNTGLPPGLKVFAFKFDPAVPTTVYVTSSSSSEVYKSTDSGDTWAPAENGLPVDFDVIRDLAPVRGAAGELFALVEEASNNILLYASTDGGANWAQVHDFQTAGLRALAAAGEGDGIVVAATRRSALRSSDGGVSFAEANSGLLAQNIVRVASKRFNPSRLYASGSFAGPFVSTDGGAGWVESTNGMPETGVQDWSLALSAQDENVLVAFQFPEFFLTTDGGANWTSTMADPGPFGDCGGIDVYTLAFAPSQPDLWAGHYSCSASGESLAPEILRSTDNGANWTPLFELPPAKLFDFSIPWGRIEVHPTNPNIVLESALVFPSEAQRFWVIRRTADHGASWTDVLTSPSGWAYLAMAPGDPTRVYAGADGIETEGGVTDVFRSDDTGQTWTPLNTALECITALAVDYEDPDTVYLGCFDLYVSTDAGLTWEAKGTNGLPDPPRIDWLDVVELDGVKSLLAGTNTGIYTYPLNVLFEDGFESGDTSAWSVTVP